MPEHIKISCRISKGSFSRIDSGGSSGFGGIDDEEGVSNRGAKAGAD